MRFLTRHKKLSIGIGFLVFFLCMWSLIGLKGAPIDAATSSLPAMDTQTLSGFDGTDPSKPIYVALDGLVYDVTPGKSFYEVGGTYHFIAGTDASAALHVYGASIIRSKYAVVARFVRNY